jgi:dTDP-4-dehydrorhamnose 3,5-epimerase
MNVQKTNLDGVLKITPPTNFEDFRGEYVEIYNESLYNEAGIRQRFIQDDISVSRQHVLRGIHGDQATTKLVSCLDGCFYLVVLDYRTGAPTFGKWEAFTLSEKNRHQILIPPGFGNGHVVMSERAMFHYKQTTTYDRAGQFTVTWNDPRFNIFWPIGSPILSHRDLTGA